MNHCAHCRKPVPSRSEEDELARALARRVNIVVETGGRPRRFCSTRCRKRAFRRRQAGLPEAAFPEGAARGQIEAAGKEARLHAAAAEFRAALDAAGGPSIYEKRGLQSVG